MIKKSVFEEELISGMQKRLAKIDLEENINSLSKAVDYINSAIDIFDQNKMYSKSDKLLSLLLKVAEKIQPKLKDPRKIHDKCNPINSDKMIKNLLDHGTVFNCSMDQNLNDDVLEVEESTLETFEEELD